MKKFATAAVAATMTLGLLVPAAGAAEDKGSSLDDAYSVTTVVSGNKCTITYSSGFKEVLTRTEAAAKLRNTSMVDNQLQARKDFLQGTKDSTRSDFERGEGKLALQACANGQNYTTGFENRLSSMIEPHEGRAAAYWLSVIVPTLLGIAALGAAFSPEFRHMLPAPVLNFLTEYFK
ncbi:MULTISPECIES: hypothetical protein [unclassified Corynebacterium]|uniref:hypothetical protein n=1 Tax=unclassified Corynebacterium TaxID=2624378 RepID=UPI0021096093|nr:MULTISPECIES: hypothetical protein [unclassified Corynebacterium]MCQ4609921.1 hypothetical protein [Corynebacterium sp. CCUG 61414]MDK8364291.1 hypothetical protein [Corynebacterium sp. UMB10119B]